MDSMFMYVSKYLTETICTTFREYILIEEFDTDSVIEDVQDIKQSNLFTELLQSKQHIFTLIQTHMISNSKEVQNDISRKIFNSIHTYLLHSADELYRIKNNIIDSKMRFSTQIQTEEQESCVDDTADNIYQIDFGQSVLKWLRYSEEPTFNDFTEEIINNPVSTITSPKYAEYEEECKLLCDSVDIDIYLQELMSLKLYTDTTKYQSALRRAFWLKSDQQQKRNFYHWAITIYKTFMRFQQPATSP
eukprot:548339_1